MTCSVYLVIYTHIGQIGMVAIRRKAAYGCVQHGKYQRTHKHPRFHHKQPIPPSPSPTTFNFPPYTPLSTHLVLFNNLTDVVEVFIGEHEANVATDVRQDLFQ